jgi:hypothetical protein
MEYAQACDVPQHMAIESISSEMDDKEIVKPWEKNKNILFIDFNGVISYHPFWITFREKHLPIFGEIEQKLFR